MTIHTLFEAQAHQTPEAVALMVSAPQPKSLTYRELNAWANRLARHLQRLEVGPEVVVGVHMEPSLERVVALLAILKAGGAYLPLDPAYPQARLGFMLADSQAPIVLTQAHLRESLLPHSAKEIVFTMDDPSLLRESAENLAAAVVLDHPAYIIYTSGSTGQPKGVIGLHRGAVNRFRWMWEAYPFAPGEICCQKTALSFVDSIWEIFGPLLQGVPSLIVSSEVAGDPQLLVQALAGQHVTQLVLVPSLLRVILEMPRQTLEGLSELKYWTVSGEALPLDLAQQFHERLPGRILLNLYGSSEVAADATAYEIPPDEAHLAIPIGRPIAKTQVYLLDGQARPVPSGEAGELFIGGDNLARGYLHRPELTAEKFIPDPFSSQPGARLYKSGDLARLLPDGNLEFLGRVDHQVKIRGSRVELGEVGAALAQHSGVKDVVVIAAAEPQESSQKRLIAYLVANEQPSPDELRRFLNQTLPDYMIPSLFIFLAALPLTPNGKIDRLALPRPTGRPQLETPWVGPRTLLEKQLTDLWAETLGLEAVGIYDGFLDLGGHSLLAIQLISRLRQAFRVELPLRQLFEEGTVAAVAEQMKQELLHRAEAAASPILPLPREKSLPLSFAQQRLWFLDQLDPGNLAYNMSEAIALQGPLDLKALEGALGEILRRHEALRTCFPNTGGQPVQVITGASGPYPLKVINCVPEAVEGLITEEARRPFDLAKGPLFRATLLQVGEQAHVLLLTMHHIVSDGWSLRVLFDELTSLYNAFVTGQPSPLPELPVQYADFAAWQQGWLQGPLLAQQLTYWRDRLGGNLPTLHLPTDHPRPAIQGFNGLTYRFLLPAPLVQTLKTLSRQEGVTLFMALLAAFKVLLYRYTRQTDLPVGTPVANRNRDEVEGLIGFFVNTLVIRTNLAGNPTYRSLLKQVREAALGAYSHQDLPFERLVDELQPDRDLSQQPLFQVMFALQDSPVERLQLANLQASALTVEQQTAQFDLSLDIIETDYGQGLIGAFEYNTDLFEAATIERMAGHFQTLLEGIVANPEAPITELPLLTPAERRQLLVDWNRTGIDYPGPVCVHHLFEAQAEQTPDRLAVVAPQGETVSAWSRLTYRELNERANRLAHYLQSLGVGPEVPVALCLDRSAEMLVAVLGVLKAGGAYVPLDPFLPPDRLAFMLEDTGAPLLLTQAHLRARLPASQAQVICLDAEDSLFAGGKVKNPSSGVAADHLAYIIFTSGSTGRSKGVMVSHRSLANAYYGWEEVYQLRTEAKAHLQMANFAFDVFSGDWVRALCSGGKLVLAPRDYLLSPDQLYGLIRREGVDIAEFVPAIFRSLLQYLEASGQRLDFMRWLIVGSDSWYLAESKKAMAFCGPQTRLINSYGLTEATIDSSYASLAPDQAAILGQSLQADQMAPIGRPFPNTQLYILDGNRQPVPVGVPGELCVGGVSLARGYLNRPELTAEKFIPNPFSAEPDSRLYRTGDLARYGTEGQIELLGRIDHQVKLRGFRIELGEIEARLGEHPAVRQAVALIQENESAPGDKRLVAYIAAKPVSQSPLLAELMEALAAERLAQWQMVYDNEALDQAQEATFNITGWNSSYTGQPLPAEAMREWVEGTVARILALKPERVLEIGCGTGLLLFRIAPHCLAYHGTDFSQTALNYVQGQLQKEPIPGVNLSRRLADNFEGFTAGSFDTIIINSVIQYFPSLDYLLRVLTQVFKLLKPGGRIFIGDVRHLGLLELFHTAVQRFQAPDNLSLGELRRRIKRSLSQEEELLIHPAFFASLQRHLPGLGQVEIQLKPGRSHNELSQFRYDVTLHAGPPPVEEAGGLRIDWQEKGLTLASLQELLKGGPDIVQAVNIPNARLALENRALALLEELEDYKTVKDLRQALASARGTGIEPEDISALVAGLPYRLDLSWANSDGTGNYEAIFRRRFEEQATTGNDEYRRMKDASGKLIHPSSFTLARASSRLHPSYANNPLQPLLGQKLGPQLRSFLKQKLPDYMVPNFFVVMDAFPLTSNGKVDRQALPAPDLGRPTLSEAYVAPRQPVEELVAGIWSELLGVERVGIDDNFFELGGHSLLATQLVSRLRQAFQLEFPLRHIFESPTVAGLAALLPQYETKPGQVAAIARLRQQIKGMSPEQIQAMLREKQKAKSG